MSPTHVVIDGSNIATEGRALPSLRQLDDAVRQFQEEFPGVETIVVVDATFGHRIPASERKAFDEAVAHGELVSPPAGAIGRGDAFVLRIAERVGGQVLSNDSFQEFHADHPWLFEEGRLIGGKPVPRVGWIFTPRLPVRGPRSRTTTQSSPDTPRSAKSADGVGRQLGGDGKKGAARTTGATNGKQTTSRSRRGRSGVLAAVEAAVAEATEAASALEEEQQATGENVQSGKPKKKRSTASGGARRRRRRRSAGDPEVQAAIQVATEEAIGSRQGGGDGRKPSGKRTSAADTGPQAVNDPLTFLTFISEHPLGDVVKGVVSNFVSHGAMVDVGPMHCYVPLSGLGTPPPNSARAALHKGETRSFVVVALDPPRRGAQLALAEVADVQLKKRVDTAVATVPKQSKPAGAKSAKEGAGTAETKKAKSVAKGVATATKAPANTGASRAAARRSKAPAKRRTGPAKAPVKTMAKAPAKRRTAPAKATAKATAKAPAKRRTGPAKAPAKAAAKAPAKRRMAPAKAPAKTAAKAPAKATKGGRRKRL